jgi:hypothetical protein
MQIDNDDDGIPENVVGQEYVDIANAKKEAAMPQMPQAPSIPNPAIAQVKKSPARQEIERIREEKADAEQNAKDEAELKQIKFYNQLEKDHPILVATGRGIKKIVGTTTQKIDSAGGRFIQDQNAADRVMRKSSIPKPQKRKKEKETDGEDVDIEDESSGSSGGNDKSKFPFREFDSGSSLPKAAYLPKNQFTREYKSVGVPVTLRMTGANNRPSDGMPGMQHGMPEMPMGKKGKKGAMLEESIRGGISMGRPQPSDNSGMGEYKSLGNPITLKQNVAMGEYKNVRVPTTLNNGLGDFRNVGVPNSLSGVSLGGLGARQPPRIVMPVMTKENITMPNTLPLKKKVNK